MAMYPIDSVEPLREGNRWVRFNGHLWFVMQRRGGKVLLIRAEDCNQVRAYVDERETSEACGSYVNGGFGGIGVGVGKGGSMNVVIISCGIDQSRQN